MIAMIVNDHDKSTKMPSIKILSLQHKESGARCTLFPCQIMSELRITPGLIKVCSKE